jgi:cytoskeleton protein RodZ
MTSSAEIPAPSPDDEDADSSEAITTMGDALDELRVLAQRVQQAGGSAANVKIQIIDQGKIIPLSPASAQALQQLSLDLGKSEKPSAKTEVRMLTPEKAAETLKADAAKRQAAGLPAKRVKVGETLKQARLAQKYSVADVAEELKIRHAHIEAIEAGDYTAFPSRTYAVGFVRNYAMVMGLNADELVMKTRVEIGAVLPQSTPHYMPMEDMQAGGSNQLPGMSMIAFGLAAALLIYAVGYSFLRPAAQPESYPASLAASLPVPATVAQETPPSSVPSRSMRAPIPVAVIPMQATARLAPPAAVMPQTRAEMPVASAPQSAAPSAQSAQSAQAAVQSALQAVASSSASPVAMGVESPILPAPSASAALPNLQQGLSVTPVPAIAGGDRHDAPRRITSRIRLQAQDSMTVQIFDAGGRMLAERTIGKGEAFFVPDNADYTMATSNAGAMRLQVDGRELPPLGGPEEAVHNIPLNADELLNAMN